AVDQRHVVGFVVEGEPDPGATRSGPGGIETIGPLPPVVERAGGLPREARHNQVLVPQPVGDLEAPVPPYEQRDRRNVRRGRPQAFVIECRPNLLRGAAEVPERPQQLDVRVAHGPHRRERSLRILVHRVPHRVQLEPDAVERAKRGSGVGTRGSGRSSVAPCRGTQRFPAIPPSSTRSPGCAAGPTPCGGTRLPAGRTAPGRRLPPAHAHTSARWRDPLWRTPSRFSRAGRRRTATPAPCGATGPAPPARRPRPPA